MPCSCKTVKKQPGQTAPVITYRIPGTARAATQKLPGTSKSLQKPSDTTSRKLQSETYDFSSTTKPTQLCFNCTLKHLGLAYKFFQSKQEFTYLMGIGQLGCAYQHLKTTHSEFAGICAGLASKAFEDSDNTELLQQLKALIQELVEYVPERQAPRELPQLPFMQQILFNLLKAYSMLFVQVSYEEVNKTWATAQLTHTGTALFRAQKDRDAFMRMRQIWKLIQSMQPYDKTYEDAQKALREEILKQWQSYKENKG